MRLLMKYDGREFIVETHKGYDPRSFQFTALEDPYWRGRFKDGNVYVGYDAEPRGKATIIREA